MDAAQQMVTACLAGHRIIAADIAESYPDPLILALVLAGYPGGRQPMSDDSKVQRLMAAIYPTRTERALGAIVTACYRIDGDTGPISWLGDQADVLRCHLQHRRADRA